LGLLSRHKEGSRGRSADANDTFMELALRLDELEKELKVLASRQDSMDKSIRQAPGMKDYEFLSSEVARLRDELDRMDSKHKEGILTLYSQIYKELKAMRGDRTVQVMDAEPVTEEKLGKVSGQLSRLAKTWREMKPPSVNEPSPPV